MSPEFLLFSKRGSSQVAFRRRFNTTDTTDSNIFKNNSNNNSSNSSKNNSNNSSKNNSNNYTTNTIGDSNPNIKNTNT